MRKLLKFATCMLSLGLMIVALGLTALCAWAITGPRDITKYADYVETSINGALKNNHIKIGRTYVEWDSFDELLSIRAENVEVYSNVAGKPIAAFPQVLLKYGFTSLLYGYLIPSELRLVKPRIDLTNLVHKGAGAGLSLEDFDLGRLDKVSISDGVLIAPDAKEWSIGNATLWYNEGSIRVDAHVNRADGEAVQVLLRTNSDQSDSFLKASFTNFNTQNLAFYFPEISKARFVASGRASLTANPKQKRATFDIDKYSGEYNDPALFQYPLEVKQGSVSGSYDISKKQISLTKFESLYTDDFKLSGRAVLTNFNSFDIDLDLANLKTVDFKKYWPAKFGNDALRWVNGHVTGGLITDGTLKVKISPEEIASGKLNNDSLDLKFAFKDAGTLYMENFTPVTNANGTGEMNASSLKISVDNAVLGNSAITQATAAINNIGTPEERLTVAAHMEGPVQDVAEFYIKLNKTQKLFVDKNDLTGKASTDLNVKMPLLDKLKTSDIEYNVKSAISEAGVKNFYSKLNFSGLKLNLIADNNSYSIKGDGVAGYGNNGDNIFLQNAPVTLEVANRSGQTRIAFGSDITSSALQFPMLEVKKAPGEPGKITGEVIDGATPNPILTQLNLDSKTIRMSAKGSLIHDYSNFATLDITSLQYGKNNIAAHIATVPYLNAELKATYFDAGPVIRYLKTDRPDDNSQYKVLLKADEVALLGDQSLTNAYLTLECAKSCDTINIDSQQVSFNQAAGNLKVKTDNAGNMLKGFGLYPNMIGGKMEIAAKVNGSSYDGKLSIADFKIVKAHVLAKMLTVGSLTGIADLVSGNGISFKKLTSDMHMDKHEVTVENYRMVGAAIGITAKGAINRDKYTADVSGNIIPAYTANTLLGNIPLIGPAVIGDEGVFALAYHMTGDLDDPSIKVNPLSVLAPGVLKNVFQ